MELDGIQIGLIIFIAVCLLAALVIGLSQRRKRLRREERERNEKRQAGPRPSFPPPTSQGKPPSRGKPEVPPSLRERRRRDSDDPPPTEAIQSIGHPGHILNPALGPVYWGDTPHDDHTDRDDGREGDTGGSRHDNSDDRSSPPDSGSGDTGSSPAGSD